MKTNLQAARAAEKCAAETQKWYPLRRYQPKTILDIGANVGSFLKLIRNVCPDATIFSFEPLKECFEELNKVTKSDGNAFAFNCAIGDTNEQTIIHRSAFSPSSSLLPMAALHKAEFPYTVDIKSEYIPVRRLDDMAREMNLVLPVIIKVDVQGFEDRVVRGGPELFKQSSAVILELSSYKLYERQGEFGDVLEQMRQLGFTYRGNIDQMLSPIDSRILQFDALFENLQIST